MLILLIQFGVFTALKLVLWLLCFAWLVSVGLTLYGLFRERRISPLKDERMKDPNAPLVSVLVPARNEEGRVLGDSVRSILAQDYGRFEVIAIDDRSTDATGIILKSLAKGDARLQVIEGEELPSGWLGKPYAMHQGCSHARGEWILATDADMIFDQAALRTAMNHVLAEKADALTLIPRFEAGSFWERVMIPTWKWVFLMFALFYRISNPKSQGAAGIGGFFLMRRTVLEQVGGYEALQDEVLEDVRLAEMIKRLGAGLLTEHAPGLISTRMYRTFGEMWECSTKNWFSGMKFSMPFALSCVVSMYFMSVAPPLIALASALGVAAGARADLWLLFIPAALSWLLQVLVLAMVSKASKVSAAYALTAPLGLGLLYTMLLDSSVRITTGKGVTWKGRRIYERGGVRPPRLRMVRPDASGIQE